MIAVFTGTSRLPRSLAALTTAPTTPPELTTAAAAAAGDLGWTPPEALAWRHPVLYQLYFALSPFAAVLRARELRAVLGAIDRVAQPTDGVLELGCGPGTYTRHIAVRCRRVVAVDSSGAMLRSLSVRMSRAAIENVEQRCGRFPDAIGGVSSFDGVVAAGVFDYMPDLEATLKACRAGLRPGGWSVFTVPLARAAPRAATLLEGRLVRPAFPRRSAEVRAAAAAAGLSIQEIEEVRLARAGRTLVVQTVRRDRSGGG